MYYSVTQVCRCNEETRTNSSETSLTGQPLYDTSTNELYIGDGETTIQNLSPIQNLKAGTGMTYTNGSVSLNEGTQTNAGGIKVWAENNDIYYSTPNGGGAQLFPIIRTYHPGYTQTHSNSHTLRGTASTPYDTGGRVPHSNSVDITLNYMGTITGEDEQTTYATGRVYCNNPDYDNYTESTSSVFGSHINANTTFTDTIEVYFHQLVYDESFEYVSSQFTIYGTPQQYLGAQTKFNGFITQQYYPAVAIDVTVKNSTGSAYTFDWSLSCTIRKPNGNYTGSDIYYIPYDNVVNIGETRPNDIASRYDIISLTSHYIRSGNYIITDATMNGNTSIGYDVFYTYIPDGYLYEGTTTQNIGEDAENVQVSPTSPSGMTATVDYSGSTATISASYISDDNSSDSISGRATLSYNTPIYGYYTNVSTYIGSDYGARVTSTSSSVTGYSSGTSGSYFWVNMRAASQTSVSASAVSYWDSWVPAYNSYHYPIELNGVRYNFNTIALDGVNYTATAEKYSKR